MRNYLTIAGKDSRDFGVYISGQGTFSAPEKAYTFYNVPGRNGAIIGNDNRLENIEVSYECFIYSNFNQNIADFRTFLLSLDGYQKLSDSYHPDEYRFALYLGPFEPEVTTKNDAGSFTLTFNCKPQRFLISGDATYSWIPGGTQLIRGEEITVYVPRITNSGAYTILFDGRKTAQNGSLASARYINFYADDNQVKEYYFNGDNVIRGTIYSSGTADVKDMILHPYVTWVWQTNNNQKLLRTDDPINIAEVYYCTRTANGQTISYDVLEDGTSLNDVFTKLMAVDYGVCLYSGDLYVRDISYSESSATGFKQLFKDANVWSRLTVEETYTFTSYNLTQDGFVTLKSSFPKSQIQVIYTADDEMSNPTMFPSSPLIRVYGTGSFTMDGVTVTVTDCTSYVDIDCEMMDCYEGSTNRNKDVTFSTYDFPKLQPGTNEIDNISGITAIEITPRWWRV